jgi:hypothetical protein
MAAFLRMLWSGRERPIRPSVQERVAQYTCYPPHRNVIAAPIRPPVKKDGKRG